MARIIKKVAIACALAASVAWTSAALAAAAPRAPAFKGSWQGPAVMGPPPTEPGRVPGVRTPKRFKVLVLGGARGFHHDSIAAGMTAVYRWGQETGLWDAELKTDFALINPGGGGPMNAGFQPKGLKDFDAVVVVSVTGDWGLTLEQKEAFLSFVKDEGKGLVIIHAGLDANHNWPGYIDMIGGEFAGHPFNTAHEVLVNFPIVNEDPSFPAVAHLPRAFRKQEEVHLLRNYLRSEVNVLLRLDESKLDYTGREDRVPPDHDFPVAWSKAYGKGRVFASTIGHATEAFSDPEVERMYAEAIKWTLGLTEGSTTSHEKRN
jgi:hypothetical protein